MGGPSTVKAAVRGPQSRRRFPAPPQSLSGIITLEADVSATRPDLAALDGTITFPELALTFSALELAQKQVSTIAIASGVGHDPAVSS